MQVPANTSGKAGEENTDAEASATNGGSTQGGASGSWLWGGPRLLDSALREE